MNLANIFTGGAADLSNAIFGGLDNLFTSDKERDEGKAKITALVNDKILQMERMATELLKGQQEIAKIDQASGKWFQAGWRPMIGWAGAFAMIYNFIFHPIASVWVELPTVNGDALYPIVMGMLGIAGMRSYDKRK